MGLGHLIPHLEFAKRLVVHHGIRVSLLVVTTSEPSAATQDQLLGSPHLPADLHIIHLPPVDVDKMIIDYDDALVLTRLCTITGESLRSLKSVLIEIGKPKALVTDLFATQAFDVCKELSIPAYLYSTTSAAFNAFMLYLQSLTVMLSHKCEFIDLPGLIQVPGCSPIWIADLLDQDLEPMSIKGIQQNPFFKKIPTPPFYPVGPIIKQEETLSYTECLEWLDKQPPDSVLFLKFGSGGTLSFEQQTELACGLELSQQRFMWVVRKPTDTPGAGFLNSTRDVGFVVSSWAPQVAVLAIPPTEGFLSHCGWNSALESIVHGLPIVAWPLYAEQRMNATLLAEVMGVAVKAKMEAGETGRALSGEKRLREWRGRMMEGEEGKVIRCRVKELKESAAKALNSNRSSYDSPSCVADQWKTELN
ncbi:AP2 domain class transcription factor [Hibiscus syriacus]|uniref:Glycosyltransferase n=1 Tax=Hibiscus syriacus TaxID=106335 RepID=A0A6A2WNX7_HIBSY|nr:AP2 domain class transcription factor [Hibiscus syriacus]